MFAALGAVALMNFHTPSLEMNPNTSIAVDRIAATGEFVTQAINRLLAYHHHVTIRLFGLLLSLDLKLLGRYMTRSFVTVLNSTY